MKLKFSLFILLATICFSVQANPVEGKERLKAEFVFEQLATTPNLSPELVKSYTDNLSLIQKIKLTRLAVEDVKNHKVNQLDQASVGMYILAVILPPLAVWLHTGDTNVTLINLLLTILGWLPGVVHALVFVLGV